MERERCIVASVYVHKIEKSEINTIILHFKELEEEEQTKPKLDKGRK